MCGCNCCPTYQVHAQRRAAALPLLQSTSVAADDDLQQQISKALVPPINCEQCHLLLEMLLLFGMCDCQLLYVCLLDLRYRHVAEPLLVAEQKNIRLPAAGAAVGLPLRAADVAVGPVHGNSYVLAAAAVAAPVADDACCFAAVADACAAGLLQAAAVWPSGQPAMHSRICLDE